MPIETTPATEAQLSNRRQASTTFLTQSFRSPNWSSIWFFDPVTIANGELRKILGYHLDDIHQMNQQGLELVRQGRYEKATEMVIKGRPLTVEELTIYELDGTPAVETWKEI